MKIVQITTDVNGDRYELTSEVYGLGDDNKVYYWNSNTTEWVLWKRQ